MNSVQLQMSSRLQLDVCNLGLGKRHLVNAYEIPHDDEIPHDAIYLICVTLCKRCNCR